MGVVLGIYLFRLGLSSFDIGLIIASGLAGSALATVVTSVGADRVGRKLAGWSFGEAQLGFPGTRHPRQ
jgi:hypothetical protein